MIGWILAGAFSAWVLTLFGADTIFIKAVNELFSLNVTSASYYFTAAVLGIIVGIVYKLRPKPEGKQDEEEDI